MASWDENFPESVTEAVFNYLKAQEIITNEAEEGLKDDSALRLVQSFVDEIIAKIGDRAELIEDFQAKLKAHNQFPLFDLSSVIPDFFIDDELYDKLTFRENLVVSYLNYNNSPFVPKVVGGLCLDIQKAKGKNPLYRKHVGLEQKIIELLTAKLNVMHKACVSEISGPKTPQESATELLNKMEIEEMAQSNLELQEFVTSIKPKYERISCKFLVHVSSQFDVEGHMAGSRITAWVDRNFHTLEEKRTEFLKEDIVTNEKTLYCALQARRYFIKHTSKIENIDDKKFYSMAKTKALICEGANFILMRYLAITRYMGSFEMSTIYINGDMCRNIYECLGPESGIVNEQKLDLCKIYRTIMEECGITHHCITVLTLHGRIIKQEWHDTDYVLQVNPLCYIENAKPTGNEHLLLEKIWETDMQLFSEFLDCKTACVMKIKSYLEDHPEFKNMMADYIHYTLMMKPEDVLDFTIRHFSQYNPKSFQGMQEDDWNA